jgi:hypothetical protein
MSASELESLGLSRGEARRLARRRLGRRRIYRRAAMRELGADARGLLELLPIRRLKRNPGLAPCLLGIVAALALGLNPARRQALESMRHLLPFTGPVELKRMIPLSPAGVVPVGFAAVVLWIVTLVGTARIAARLTRPGTWRICLYAGALLGEAAVFAGVVWATGMQLLLASGWGFDIGQGLALGLFLLAYSWSAYGAMNLWWRDVERRCPVCLSLPAMPEIRGKQHDVLVEPLEVESVCLQGHGLAVESRWRRSFDPQAVNS